MTAAISMETFLAHLNRPGATPAPTTPRPTPAEPFPSPFPSEPRVTDPDLHRWAPNADRQTLTALHTATVQDPPVGPLLDDLARAVTRCRQVS
ncbi:hypothetical protein AB0J14_38595 [Micromonospora arborensis]|uniref:hypothetical protein n=1 Tax=Micromonospora arborensis TaxID=2116518 RepID=UPI0033CF6AEE